MAEMYECPTCGVNPVKTEKRLAELEEHIRQLKLDVAYWEEQTNIADRRITEFMAELLRRTAKRG